MRSLNVTNGLLSPQCQLELSKMKKIEMSKIDETTIEEFKKKYDKEILEAKKKEGAGRTAIYRGKGRAETGGSHGRCQ